MKKITITITAAIVIILSSFNQTQQPNLKASIERGQKVYASTCLACHQADGDGVPRMNPTLMKTKWVLGDKKALAKIVLNGLAGGEIEIDGDSYHNPMPAQASVLTDLQIADVLTYVRNSFGNKASLVTPAEVKGARATAKSEVAKPGPAKPVKKSTKG